MTKAIFLPELNRAFSPAQYGLLAKIAKLYPHGRFEVTDKGFLAVPCLYSPKQLDPIASAFNHAGTPLMRRLGRCDWRDAVGPPQEHVDLQRAQAWLNDAIAAINSEIGPTH